MCHAQGGTGYESGEDDVRDQVLHADHVAESGSVLSSGRLVDRETSWLLLADRAD